MVCHTNYVVIDLDAVEENFDAISRKAGCDVMTIVKADGYGHGAVPLARHLEDRSAFFGVSCAAEALELIRGGIQKPILILGHSTHDTFPALIRHRIRPTVFRWDDALALSAEALRQGTTARFHFAVDTGMSRIGVPADETGADLCAKIAGLPGLMAEGIFSHYATADEEDLTRARAQGNLFERFLQKLEHRGLQIPLVHFSNSAGIMNFSHHYNMVRAGIVLHGTYPSDQVDPSLLPIRPTLSWYSRISYLQALPAGRQIGYGGTYTTTRETKVATIPVGYADGYHRVLSGRFHVLIRGRKAPILGRICMDQMMVDVTDIPDAAMEDPVVLIGTQGEETISIEQMASACGTINYEIMCGIQRRVPRIYLKHGQPAQTLAYLPEE